MTKGFLFISPPLGIMKPGILEEDSQDSQQSFENRKGIKNMTHIIETRGLTKEYGGVRVAESIDLHLPEGKIYGLLGRNGAGKTTLMKMILRLVHPTSGTIELFGQDYREEPGALLRIGSMIETPGFYGNLTAWENLTLIGKLRGIHKKEPLKEALELVGLQDQIRKPFSDYSLGMKQRLGIAAAILHQPELLILDEPTNGLDPIGIKEVRIFLKELVRTRGTTILISSHIISEMEQLADVVGILHQGQLLEERDLKDHLNRGGEPLEPYFLRKIGGGGIA